MTMYGDLVTGQALPFSRMRRLISDIGLQAGVVGANDFKVTASGMTASAAAGSAFLPVTGGLVAPNLGHALSDATVNVTIAAAHASLPRIDQIALQWNDSGAAIGDGGNVPSVVRLAGTATSGATLDNRNGAATLPPNCVRLADVLVPAAAGSISAGNVRDRRPWARGAYSVARGDGSTAYANTTTTPVAWPHSTRRVECSGAPLEVIYSGVGSTNNVGLGLAFAVYMDGAGAPGLNVVVNATSNGAQALFHTQDVITPAAGSHVFDGRAASYGSAATVNVTNSSGLSIPHLVIREVLPSVYNG